MKNRAFTLIELLVVVAIIGILAAVGVVAYNGYTGAAKEAVAKANFKTVIKWIQADAMKCVINGGTVPRLYDDKGGVHHKRCSDTADNFSPFYEGALFTHIGLSNFIQNPYGNIASDPKCGNSSSWGGRGIQQAIPGKQLCNGVVALHTLSKNTNGCDREMVIQVGFKSGYWTFSTKSSNDTLSKIICINHR